MQDRILVGSSFTYFLKIFIFFTYEELQLKFQHIFTISPVNHLWYVAYEFSTSECQDPDLNASKNITLEL